MRRLLPIALLLHWSTLAAADELQNAYFVCDIFEKTNISSECQVSRLTSEVDVIIDTNGEEAGKVCTLIARKMVEQRRAFGGRWKLRIFAPDRADTPIAACALR